jgi:ATP-dependent helicase/nuclease subunit B
LREQLDGVAGVEVVVEQLPRASPRSRFAPCRALQHLEKYWAAPLGGADSGKGERQSSAGLRLVACSNPEAEAVFAAREVLRFVRGQGGRFREVAVIVRSLDGYDELLRRVFTRYEIPFFLDRRESVAHHPLAELTRYALRTVAFGWRHDDWFGTLKTGLVDADEAAIDRLENEALARGWQARTWLAPLSLAPEAAWAARLERLRQRVAPPFKRLARGLGAGAAAEGSADLFASAATGQPTGAELAQGLRTLWADLRVEAQLTEWTEAAEDSGKSEIENQKSKIHLTVWEQLNGWLDNLALAFAAEAMPLGQWLPILETGLASLTVGVIPPALDQVLIGAIDRSRNPELQLALVLGLNEGVFPAPPQAPQLLTEADRETLAQHGAELGPDRRRLLGREQYLGYIACTRPAQQLALTYSLRGAEDEPLNPSPFVARLQDLFPALRLEAWPPWPLSKKCEHPCELNAPLIRAVLARAPGAGVEELASLPRLAWLGQAQDRLRVAAPGETLAPAVAEQLYGPEVLATSVSRLERFAACPFRFFVDSGLGAEERRRFEVDWRQRGSFQHDVLARFHQQLHDEGKAWREVSVEEARERIGQLAREVTRDFSDGLFQSDDQSLFTAQSLTRALQDFIATLIVWMRSSYQFNPSAVELSFGGVRPGLPAWELDLGEGHRMVFRGIIDRVDLAPGPEAGAAYCVVVDYKSGRKTIDPILLANGVQMQLPAYLAVLGRLADPRPVLGVGRLIPVGVFYVNLRGNYQPGHHRRNVLDEVQQTRLAAYQHHGRFCLEALPWLDSSGAEQGNSGQFSYAPSRKVDRRFHDPLPAAEFNALLDLVEAQLREIGARIFAGAAEVAPYRKGASEVACQHCDYRPICRIDPWTHEYRQLRRPAARAE